MNNNNQNNNFNLYAVALYVVPTGMVNQLLDYFDLLQPEDMLVMYSDIASIIETSSRVPDDSIYVNMKLSFYSEVTKDYLDNFKSFIAKKIDEQATNIKKLQSCLEVPL